MILSYDTYLETVEQKEKETDRVTELEDTMKGLLQTLIKEGVLKPKK